MKLMPPQDYHLSSVEFPQEETQMASTVHEIRPLRHAALKDVDSLLANFQQPFRTADYSQSHFNMAEHGRSTRTSDGTLDRERKNRCNGQKSIDNTTERPRRLLSCPFRKGPGVLGGECSGAWTDIPALKHHLTEVHVAYTFHTCPRCNAGFYSMWNLYAHYRNDKNCYRRPKAMKLIESTKASLIAAIGDGGTFIEDEEFRQEKERDDWVEIFRVLFPEVADIPSPYWSGFDPRIHTTSDRESRPPRLQKEDSCLVTCSNDKELKLSDMISLETRPAILPSPPAREKPPKDAASDLSSPDVSITGAIKPPISRVPPMAKVAQHKIGIEMDSKPSIVTSGQDDTETHIGRALQWHQQIMSSKFALLAYRKGSGRTRGNEQPSQGHRHQPPENNTSFASKQNSTPSGSLPDRPDNNSSGSDGDKDGWDRRRKKKPEAPSDHQLTGNWMFACPYFQHDSRKYGSWKGCPGPGYANVSRLKEHLFRRHRLAKSKHTCIRCYAGFEVYEDYKLHCRSALACEVNPEPSLEGIDDILFEKLRSRKGLCKLTEPEKWKYLYESLFPGEDVPTPWYNYCQPEAFLNVKPQQAAVKLKEFDELVQIKLPALTAEIRTKRVQCDIEMSSSPSTVDLTREADEADDVRHAYQALVGESGIGPIFEFGSDFDFDFFLGDDYDELVLPHDSFAFTPDSGDYKVSSVTDSGYGSMGCG